MSRFDQRAGEPLGTCRNCALTFDNQAASSAHLSETFHASTSEPKKGHSVSITNPSRSDRIRTHLENKAQDALYDFIEAVWRDIDRGDLTEDEVTEGLRTMPDFSDAWMNREDG